MARFLKWFVTILAVIVAGAGAWLYFSPPELIRVGTAYSAKIVCSNAFVAGRDGQQVLEVDVQAPGHPILRYVSARVDQDRKTVSADLLGLFGGGFAAYREGTGCATLPDRDLEAAALPAVAGGGEADATALWPDGERVDASQDQRIAAILDDAALVGPSARAVVIVHNGRIIGERYGEGFSAATPLLGWSMTKTVTAAIVGTLVADGRMSLEDSGLFEEWSIDGRDAIAVTNLMSMDSGLEFNEDYGDVTDVTRMLYLEPDMAQFALAKPLLAEPGSLFSYSSGSTVLVSRVWQNMFDDPVEALAWPRRALFDPLGMTSVVLEADARGTYVGSSYMYATAHDWARFGQFLLQDGVWKGTRLVPEGFVAMMRSEGPASPGQYGRGSVWLRGPQGTTPEGEDPDARFDLPDDLYWMRGHDGQSTAIIPSRGLVVVRLGLTPSRLGYQPQRLVEAVAAALE